MKTSGSWFGSIGMGLVFAGVLVGCAGPGADRGVKPAQGQAAAVASERAAPTLVVAPSRASSVAAPTVASVAAQRSSSVAKSSISGKSGTAGTSVKLRRLVVTQAVKDREPEPAPGALPGDGSAIFAFAELSNDDGSSGNVRITFERKGGAEKVGDVSLPVPGNVPRYRTWAFTRFIRVPGVWEAVLWSDTGTELGRTSFEVAPG